MFFRGRGHHGGRSFGERGRGIGVDARHFVQGPSERLVLLGSFVYSEKDDLICEAEIEDVPFFNTPIYLENKEKIGNIDEIFGYRQNYFVSIKLGQNHHISEFQVNQKLYIDRANLMPLKIFLPGPVTTNRGGGAKESGHNRGGSDGRGVGPRFRGGRGRFGRSNGGNRGVAGVQGYGNTGFEAGRSDGNRGLRDDRNTGNRGYWRSYGQNTRGYGRVQGSSDGLSRGNNFGGGYRGNTGRSFQGGRGSGGSFGRGRAENTYFRRDQ